MSSAGPQDRLGRLLAALLARPLSLAIFAFTLVVLGLFSLLRLPVALLPSLERPHLDITLEAPRLDRASLTEEVVAPLERRLLTLPGVTSSSSQIDDGRALVSVEGEWQADSEKLVVEVERLLTRQPARQLESASTRLAPPDARPVLRLAVRARAGEPTDLLALTLFTDTVLLPELGRLEGAGELRRRGGDSARLEIEPRFAELAAHGLTVSELADRLRGSGQVEPVGQVREGGESRPLLLGRPLSRREEVADLAVGDGLRLGEVANLRIANRADGSLTFFRDEPAVLVDLYRAPGANAVRLAQAGRALLAELEARPGLPGRVELVDDSSGEVLGALSSLGNSLLLGLLLSAMILRLGLGRWRPTLALMVVVPASIVASFAFFYAFGVALDVVSLAGLALASGMLVDSSIVVLEAIAGARAAGAADPRLEGLRQVVLPLLASFVTTAVVFLPLLYLEGLARAFFGAQAFAIASSLGLALVFSLTLTPLLWGRGQGPDLDASGQRFGQEPYQRLLHAALARPAKVLVALLLLLAAALPALAFLPKTLMPEGLRRHLTIGLELGRGSETQRRAQLSSLTRALAQSTTTAFTAELALAPPATSETQGRYFQPAFTDEGRGSVHFTFPSRADLAAAEPGLRQASASVPGIVTTLRRERGALAAFADELGSVAEVEILAHSEQRAAHLEAALLAALTEAGFAAQARRALPGSRLELRFDPLRTAEERLEAENEVARLLGGETLGQLRLPGLAAELRLSPPASGQLGLLPVARGLGSERRLLPLATLANFSEVEKERPLERRDGRPSRRLTLASSLARQQALRGVLAAAPRAAGEKIELVGRSRELDRAFAQLELALGLGLLLVFLTIAALYESLRLPLVVIATVPLAMAGAFLTLFVCGSSLDVFSFLGLLLLAGIVVNNAIVLLDRAEAWRRQGETAAAAVLRAAGERYRPILMTTATTLLGLLPMAALGGEGAELRRSLALALAGGMAFSWLAVLFVMPILYTAAFSTAAVATAAVATDAGRRQAAP